MKTITFYSYKGGVGRTLMLSNFAEYLAYYGKKVVIVDFDLEAPGTHLKFGLQPDAIGKNGLVDFINVAIKDINSIDTIDQYLHSIPSKPGKEYYENIKILPAGSAPSEEYANEYSKISWYNLYYDFKSKKNISGFRIFLLLQGLIENLDPPIDYLLIDSRTGITDIGGTAITVLPDTLVCLFNNNTENIYGLQTVITSAKNTKLRIDKPQVKIVPILTRIPEYSHVDIEHLINDINIGLLNEDKIKQEELHIIRSEPDLEIIEELRFSSEKTLRESVLLRDYLNIFAALEPTLCEGQEIEELLRLIPSREDIKDDNIISSEKISFEDNIGEKKRKLKIIKPKYIDYSGGKNIDNLKKNQYSNFIDAIIKNLTVKLYDKYDYEEVKRVVNWDLLGFQISEGFFDFCAEPYYLTKTRSHFLGVIQIGWLKTFTCFISKDSEVYKNEDFGIKTFDNNRSFKDNFTKLYKMYQDFEIGTIGDHAAALEVYHNLDFLPFDKIKYERNEDSLSKWLNDEDGINNKMVICDHAVAKYLKREKLSENKNEDRFLESTGELTFRFQEPIPVGFVYKIEDIKWRKRISRAIIDAFLDNEYKFEWSKIMEQLMTYHIELFDFEALRKQLIWDLTFEEAEFFNKKLRESIKS